MKKALLFFSLFTLVACSEDVYQEIGQQNNVWETTNPDSEGSGGNTPFTHVPGPNPYDSPWDIANNTAGIGGTQVPYRFNNWTGDWGSPYLLTLRLTPYIGLAYYDGVDAYDADYFGTTLDPMNYPNLYPATGSSEIGHFIPAFPITLDGTGLNPASVVLDMQAASDHCPVLNAQTFPFTNPLPIHFDLPTGGLAVQPAEEQLLAQYGKVFFYFCEIIDPVTNMTVWSRYIMPEIDVITAPSGHWFPTFVNTNIPGVGTPVPLLFNNPSSNPSQEVILNPTSIPGGLYISYDEFFHNGVRIYVEVKTDASEMTVTLDDKL